MAMRFYPTAIRACVAPAFLVATAFTIMGCASTEKRAEALAMEAASADARSIDPFEGFNRPMYSFNMGLDQYLFKPVSDGYKFITPDFMETGVSNFFNNLRGINVVLNDVLQGKLAQAGSDVGRFLTNTTIGVAGLIDVASEFGMPHHVEDFGQTLAVWGVEDSTYLVLPIMGPTTLRDGGGGIFDRAANPSTYVPFIGVLEGISERANADGALNFINEAALDPYVFTREAFLQHRRNLISDGKQDSDIDLEVYEASEAPAEAKIEQVSEPQSAGVAVSAADMNKDAVAPDAAFDNMLQSFEEAMLKMDRFSDSVNPSRRI